MKCFYFKDGCTRNAATCVKAGQQTVFIMLSEYFGSELAVFTEVIGDRNVPQDSNACRALYHEMCRHHGGKMYGLCRDIEHLAQELPDQSYSGVLDMLHFIVTESHNVRPCEMCKEGK